MSQRQKQRRINREENVDEQVVWKPEFQWQTAARDPGTGRQAWQGLQAQFPRQGPGAETISFLDVPFLDSHRTRPLVFLSTEAAKLWVTPTRLVPSTSTSRSFTWILGKVTFVMGP